MDSFDRYFARQAAKPPRYRGQLTPAFQANLAAHFANVTESECSFSQIVALPDGSTAGRGLDLRGVEDACLGNIELSGKRVIEFLPDAGAMSSWIAARAAQLVVFDLPPEDAAARHRGWWFVKNALGYEAQSVYADLYAPPDDLGHFDVAVFCGLFQRGLHPLLALRQAAALADTIILCETASLEAASLGDAPKAIFAPDTERPDKAKWYFAHAAMAAMLTDLGFGELTVSAHAARLDGAAVVQYCIVARRSETRNITVVAASAPPTKPVLMPVAAVTFSYDDAELIDEMPLPPARGRLSVAGTDDVKAFVMLGRAGFRALRDTLRRCEIDTAGIGRVLDFGCGVGRVLRYWQLQQDVRIYGTDINAESIAWCTENLPFGQFGVNTIAPELNYPDGYFGLVYALSVFTHLPENMQEPWLRELLRIIRPGGLLYFTTHGDSYRSLLQPDLQVMFDHDELIVGGAEDPGSNHCGAFHPPRYVEKRMLEPCGLTLLEFRAEGAEGNPTQDSWLVRKD